MTLPAIHYYEIVTTEVAEAVASYEKAYGWKFEKVPELGDAFSAALSDGSRVGIRAPMHEMEKPIVRTYLRVDDVERTAKAVEALGATIALPPMEIPGRGKIVIYLLGGIEQGIWQI